jgi:LacI family transcriptional regulator, repressor for deo operon, udp, cdd, tsx, nupC, and nupG
MAGIEDVARLAGVSTATVSRALSGKDVVSEKSRAKVEAAALELGYVASHSAYTLATGRNRNIGVIMPYVDRWFFSAALEAIESTLIESGYDLTLYNLSGGEEQRGKIFNDFLLRQRVDAILTVAVHPNEAELEQLTKMMKPIIAIGGQVHGARSLAMNDHDAGKLATEHLLSLGHTRVANISGMIGADREFDQANKRKEGYLEAMHEAGLETRANWLVETDYTSAGAYKVTKQMLGDPKNAPTAIFCNSDEMGFGAIMAAKDLGLRVPQDISVIGIDNHDMSEFFGLTTIDQKVREQGAEAARLILEVLADPGLESHVNIEEDVEWKVDLLIRSSTARPSAGSR